MVPASRGKQQRAEPVASLYEQNRVRHVGTLPELEDELTQWDPDKVDWSPNRLDALVWALTELMLEDTDNSTFAGQTVTL
jgi:phage terminase large subunit-like protein